MTTRPLARKTVAAFATGVIAGVIAGAVLSHARRRPASPRTIKPATPSGGEADRRQVDRDRQETTRKPAEATAAPETKTNPPRSRGKRTQNSFQGLTKQQLYQEAKNRNIPGRSAMTKAELQRALRRTS